MESALQTLHQLLLALYDCCEKELKVLKNPEIAQLHAVQTEKAELVQQLWDLGAAHPQLAEVYANAPEKDPLYHSIAELAQSCARRNRYNGRLTQLLLAHNHRLLRILSGDATPDEPAVSVYDKSGVHLTGVSHGTVNVSG